MKKVDKTIDAIYDWVCENLGVVSHNEQSVIVPEMVKALAELVSARAGARKEGQESDQESLVSAMTKAKREYRMRTGHSIFG